MSNLSESKKELELLFAKLQRLMDTVKTLTVSPDIPLEWRIEFVHRLQYNLKHFASV